MSGEPDDPAGRRVRPVATVLDMLRMEIADDAVDAVLFSLDTVVADLGYGDVRPLPGAIAWIDQLRTRGKRIGSFANSEHASAALDLAGIADYFDEITIGTRTVPALRAAIEELGAAPERTVVVAATAAVVAAAREAKAGIVIAVARGFSSPEELRQAGAHTVVADLLELVSTVP